MSTSATPVHDDDFYWDYVVFRVENRLFKVCQHYFVKSEVFKTTFTLPSGPTNAEGSHDENPFVLEGIMVDDFHAFLKVMTQLHSSPLSMTREEWTSSLKLSTMWEFQDIRKRIIESMSELDLQPVDKILLGREYRVTTWREQGYQALIQKEAITKEELEDYGIRLGWETVARILRVRDHISRSQIWCQYCHHQLLGATPARCPSCYQYSTREFSDAEIRTEFRSDFLDQDDDSALDLSDSDLFAPY